MLGGFIIKGVFHRNLLFHIFVIFLLLIIGFIPIFQAYNNEEQVIIHVTPNQVIYEGDIINCTITGSPSQIFWKINDNPPHTTFYGSNPVIFDPEPTPLGDDYVNLTVSAQYESEGASILISNTKQVVLKRLYFGDLHFHSTFSDGYNQIDDLYQNTIVDNYVDFVCLTDHAEIINELDFTPPQPLWMFTRSLIQVTLYKMGLRDEWQIIKDNAIEYYSPGSLTTFLGFEYSAGPWYPGGFPWSEDGHEDIGHINFYYKDIYPEAPEFSGHQKHTWHDMFRAMNEENSKGHYNICFPHHPLATFGIWGAYTVNWSYLSNEVDDTERSQLLRGVEVYSKWGQAIGKYSDIPVSWSYNSFNILDKEEYWVENAFWEWSKPGFEHQRFMMIASSDNHATDRPASASMKSRISSGHPNPAGIIATYAVHNTRSEIWDAINACDSYGSQLLKIRANVRFDDQMALGRWINCTAPLDIRITAMSTFNGTDHGGKSMCPHAYSSDELDYPIEDIWVIKKDTSKGSPWCKVIGHYSSNESLAIAHFSDEDVKPNDFYFVVIKQKGQYLENGNDPTQIRDEYLSFLGPVFINSVDT